MSGLPRENVYTCQACGQFFVTVDVDYGTTPFMTSCEVTKGCKGSAVSSFYPKGPRPAHIGEPSHEWYRPESMSGMSPGVRHHVEMGGLLLRRRTDREPVLYGDDGDTYQRKVTEGVGALKIADTCKRSRP